MLSIVATPIGNLDDMSFRAIKVLKAAEVIYAEDTRHSKKLCEHYDINTSVLAYHEHNEKAITPKIIEQLQSGKNIALISDAGTPLISDPGYNLVKEAANAGIYVSPIPGCCAAIAALSASGLPTDRFTFGGFLPAKSNNRIERLTELKQLGTTLVLYESCHRILKSLNDIHTVFQDTPIVLAKEISKQFERFFYGTAASIIDTLSTDSKLTQGEFVVMIEAADNSESDTISVDADTLLMALAEHLPKSKAAEITAKWSRFSKRELYQKLL